MLSAFGVDYRLKLAVGTGEPWSECERCWDLELICRTMNREVDPCASKVNFDLPTSTNPGRIALSAHMYAPCFAFVIDGIDHWAHRSIPSFQRHIDIGLVVSRYLCGRSEKLLVVQVN